MIFHGEEVLNIKLSCEKQTHDTALRMRVHNPDMLLKTSVLLRKAANTPIQTSVQIKKQHIIQAGITRGYSMLSVGDGEDLLPLADGKAQRSRRINLLLSSWFLVCDAALR